MTRRSGDRPVRTCPGARRSSALHAPSRPERDVCQSAVVDTRDAIGAIVQRIAGRSRGEGQGVLEAVFENDRPFSWHPTA